MKTKNKKSNILEWLKFNMCIFLLSFGFAMLVSTKQITSWYFNVECLFLSALESYFNQSFWADALVVYLGVALIINSLGGLIVLLVTKEKGK